MNSLEIRYRWADVQSSQGYPYEFPDNVTNFMSVNYSSPAVYRWTVRGARQYLLALYIGETEDVVRRVGQYLAPGKQQATNLRLRAYFDAACQRGEKVALQTFEFESFQINKVTFTRELLGHSHVRKMLENFILVELHPSEVGGLPVVLNQIFNQDAKRSKRKVDDAATALKKLGLTGEQIIGIIQTSLISKTKA